MATREQPEPAPDVSPVPTDSKTKKESPLERRRRLRQIKKNQAAIELLRSWRETTDPEEIREQQETGEYLMRVLDEDRLSYRKLFP